MGACVGGKELLVFRYFDLDFMSLERGWGGGARATSLFTVN